MRIVFMGTPDFSVPPLSHIVASSHDVVAVYSQPPRRAGRGMSERKSPVQLLAQDAGIPVFTPNSLRDEDQQRIFSEHKADAAVVVAYGLILPAAILHAPRFGCFNLHASKLPRWRGAAPIQRAIMAGDMATAATIMRMETGLDTGPVCMESDVEIGPDMTAGELHDVLSMDGARLVVEALDLLGAGQLSETPQSDKGVTYAAKIEKAEAKIDFSRDACDVHNHIRGLSPFPGAWFEASKNGKTERIKVLRSNVVDTRGVAGEILADPPSMTIGCGRGAVHLAQLQRAGKKPVGADEFVRGFALEAGTHVG